MYRDFIERIDYAEPLTFQEQQLLKRGGELVDLLKDAKRFLEVLMRRLRSLLFGLRGSWW